MIVIEATIIIAINTDRIKSSITFNSESNFFIVIIFLLFVELVGSAPTSCHLAIINCYMLLCTKVQGCLK